jgi:hypothetical protein
MSENLMKIRIEDISLVSPEEMEKTLTRIMNEVRSYETEEAFEEMPELLKTIIDKLIEVSPAKFFCKTPKISEQFMDFLWVGIGKMSERSDKIEKLLSKTRDMNVNIEASDSPFRGHLKVGNGSLSGGSAFFHFKDEDYRIMGETKVILELLMDQLPLGFSNPEVQTAGHSGFASYVSSIVKGVTDLITDSR